MSKESENKIPNAEFSVGDAVRLKSASKQFIKIDKDNKPIDRTPSDFIIPYMVVSEIFMDEKIRLHSTNSKTGKCEKIKDVGQPIRVKCIWFYEGKSYEKVFWQDVLEGV